MNKVMIAGAGKIGSLIALLLAKSNAYEVYLVDIHFDGADVRRLLTVKTSIKTVAMDVSDQQSIETYLKTHHIDAVISSLPFFLNIQIANAAKSAKAHYFDLTEDVTVTQAIKAISEKAETAFVPQCGLAPGFTGIAANSLMQEFSECHRVELRVGALPQRASNALQYALTWSTDGLINIYGNPCHVIESGKSVWVEPLEGLESIEIDGHEYEAFYTSGGLGGLPDMHPEFCHTMNYKTIRYPGHCEKMRFLMNELHLNDDRVTLKRILEGAIPKTYQDLVLVYITVVGIQQGELIEKSYYKKILPVTIAGLEWSAIQISTAAGVCAVVDMVFEKDYKGLILQEQFKLTDVLKNRFGTYFVEE
ncbi:MAG: saccharopine dehydrogenase NADP-binding domain-containing protein [Legionella sp.]|nr:saccharopine dehydrogenase NADP-binding domain-containing protein [Legionella sp.]